MPVRRQNPSKKLTYKKSSSKFNKSNSNNNRPYSNNRSYSNKYFSRFYRNYKKPYSYPGVGRTIGSAIGAGVGGLMNPAAGLAGGALGGLVGQGAHSLMKTITGFGDYVVSKNSIVHGNDAVPQFSNHNRCTVITHREFVCDIRVDSANTFKLQSFAINPANATLFPWLSQLANNYEEYVMQGLVFEFKTTSATAVASTNTSLGTVIMATQYNATSAAFLNKQQMENYEFSSSTVPSQSMLHAVECDPKQTPNNGIFYVQNQNVTSVGDPRLYDLGIFNVATTGMQAASILGELWVSYKVCLLKPRLISSISYGDHWVLDATNMAGGTPFGNTPTLSSTSYSYSAQSPSQQLTALITNAWQSGSSSNTTIYINPDFTGYLMVVYQIHGGPAAISSPLVSFAGNVTDALFPKSSSGYQVNYTANGNGNLEYVVVVNCKGGYVSASGASPQISLGSMTLGSAPSNGDLYIFPISNNITN